MMNNDRANTRVNKVLLIYTGGTIGMGRNVQTGALEPLNFEHLIANLPEFAYLQTDIDTYQFTPPIDSSDMSLRRWAQLVRIIADNYDSYDGFVILHGTDTMAYTASALSFMLENLTKPVILTGSQLPIGQLRTDGKENLVTSMLRHATKMDIRWFRRSASISAESLSAATAVRRRMQTDSMPSIRSTIRYFATLASSSTSILTTSSSPTIRVR